MSCARGAHTRFIVRVQGWQRLRSRVLHVLACTAHIYERMQNDTARLPGSVFSNNNNNIGIAPDMISKYILGYTNTYTSHINTRTHTNKHANPHSAPAEMRCCMAGCCDPRCRRQRRRPRCLLSLSLINHSAYASYPGRRRLHVAVG